MIPTRTDLIQIYRDRTPLHASSDLFKKHIKKLQDCQKPNEQYDRLIEEARRVFAKQKADKIFKSRLMPDDYTGSLSQWRKRKPDGVDVERLADRVRDFDRLAVVDRYRRIPNLTFQDYWQVAYIIFSTQDIVSMKKW